MPAAGMTVRSLPWPVLEEGSLSYPQGSYEVVPAAADDGASVTLDHKLEEAGFIESLIRGGKARYGCLVSVPRTGYRKLELSTAPRQRVTWGLGVVGEPPLLRPLILTVEPVQHTLGPDDGVADGWRGRSVNIPAGGRLAMKGYLRAVSSRFHLLSVRPDTDLSPGSFQVSECTEDGFYFLIRAAPALCAFIQKSEGHTGHRNSILTHVTSRCFELLAKRSQEQRDDGASWWASHRNLTALEAELRQKGLKTWDDEDFEPERAATTLYPHETPSRAADDAHDADD